MKIEIYSKPNCTWCVKAKELMARLHLQYQEKVLDVDYTREELRSLIGEHLPLTVPQVYVDGHRVGGYEDLVEWCDAHGYGDEK